MRRGFQICFVAALAAQTARAQAEVPPSAQLPPVLSLDEALRIFHRQGLDLLIADAATQNAEGAVQIAGAVANPNVAFSAGFAPGWSKNKSSHDDCNASGADCVPWGFSFNINDQNALEDLWSGKRGLRLKVARNALAAAKMSRADAERTLALAVKTAYVQVAQALLAWEFAEEVAASNGKTLTKFQARYDKGAINEGDLQRIETQKLESDQALDSAFAQLRSARVTLAFLLGVRGRVPEFEIDRKVLDFSVPAALRDASEPELLRAAFDHRPDLIALGYSRASAGAQLDLVRRQRFPDVAFGINYQWGGSAGWSVNGSVYAPFLMFQVSSNLPVFYQLQGEQRQAEAQLSTNRLQQAKATAQVASDVAGGWAGFVAARKLVERMEGPRRPGGGLLQSAKGAFDITAYQYDKGAVSLTDYLDALRTYVATKAEYFNDLSSYWTAVFQLEAAVATELR